MYRNLFFVVALALAACGDIEQPLNQPEAEVAGAQAQALLQCEPGRARLKWYLGQNYGCSGWNSNEVATCNAYGKTFLVDVNHIGNGSTGDFVVAQRYHLPPESQIGYHKWLKAHCTCTTSPAPFCSVTYDR